jgi:hypothetical protein
MHWFLKISHPNGNWCFNIFYAGSNLHAIKKQQNIAEAQTKNRLEKYNKIIVSLT